MPGYLRKAKKLFLFCAAMAIPALLAGAAMGQTKRDGWNWHESESGAFGVLVPEGQKETLTRFRISDKHVLSNSELIALDDQRPYRDIVKSYIVKADQTIGAPFSEKELEKLIEREVATYISHYKTMNGEVLEQKDLIVGGRPAKELFIAFDDPEHGRQGLRAAFMFSDLTKFQQIYIGPEDSLFIYRNKDFFDSIQIRGGYTVEEGEFAKDWNLHVSPFEIFTVLLPPVSPPYVYAEPASHANERNDVISFAFYDPVRLQQAYFNTYGYRFDKNLTSSDMQQVLMRNHAFQYGINLSNFVFSQGQFGEFPLLETAFYVPPQAHLQNADYVRLRAVFSGNVAVVQELIATQPLAAGPFAEKLLSAVDFHPDRALERWRKDAEAQGAAE